MRGAHGSGKGVGVGSSAMAMAAMPLPFLATLGEFENARRARLGMCVCGGEELSRISSSFGVSVFVKVNRVIPFNSSNVFGVLSLEPNLDG